MLQFSRSDWPMDLLWGLSRLSSDTGRRSSLQMASFPRLGSESCQEGRKPANQWAAHAPSFLSALG